MDNTPDVTWYIQDLELTLSSGEGFDYGII